MSLILILSVVLFSLLFLQIKCQENVPCDTPDRRYGVCIPVKQCPEIVSIITAGPLTPQRKAYIVSFQCGQLGRQTLVCCPYNRVKNNDDILVPVNNGNNDNSNNNVNGNNNNNFNNQSAFLTPPQCGISGQNDPRIVGGVPAKLGEFPWMAALGFKNANNPQMPKWLCGGSLITKRHVLTAGHCIKESLYLVRLGELDLYDDNDGAHPINVRIEKKNRHPDYNPTTHINDIAILTLEDYQSSKDIIPICLPWQEPIKSKNFLKFDAFVAGWGATNFNGPSSSILMKVTMPIVDNDVCQAKYGNQAIIDQRIICAGYATGGRDSCQGDSGGPMMYAKSQGLTQKQFYLIGVVSYGFRCAEPGYAGVYSKVTEFLPWIEQNLDV